MKKSATFTGVIFLSQVADSCTVSSDRVPGDWILSLSVGSARKGGSVLRGSAWGWSMVDRRLVRHPLHKVVNLKGKTETVRILMRVCASRIVPAVLLSLLSMVPVQAADNPFHNAPESAKAQKNPLAGQQAAVNAGKALYA